jgi:hypothetical protein
MGGGGLTLRSPKRSFDRAEAKALSKRITTHVQNRTLCDRPLQMRRPVARDRLTGGSLLLFACLITVLGLWYRAEATIAVNTVSTPRGSKHVLGGNHLLPDARYSSRDGLTDTGGSGIRRRRACLRRGARRRGRALLSTNESRVFLFWAAFILTRPLGATVGDRPHEIAAPFDDGSEPPVVLEGVRGGHADQPASCDPGGCESV